MKKVLALVVMCAMLIGLLAACGGQTPTATTAAATTAAGATAAATTAAATTAAGATAAATTAAGATAAATTAAAATEAAPAEWPKITFWVPPNADMLVTHANIGDTPYGKEWRRQVEVDITFTQPPAGQETEQFNLMVAGGTLPDIIQFNINGVYPGGAAAAIADLVIIPLNEYYDAGKMPNIKRMYDENPGFINFALLDDGTQYCFPFSRTDDILSTYVGMVLRADILAEIGKEPPHTISEWDDVLRAFKEYGLEYPMTVQRGMLNETLFISAYGTVDNYFVKDGQIVFGPIQPGFKDFLALFNNWVADGLLDEEFISQDRNMINAKITSGAVGSYSGTPDSWIGVLGKIMIDEDPTVDWVGVPYPRIDRSDPKAYTQKDWQVMPNSNGTAHISTECKDVDAALRVLDWAYGDDGLLLTNWGIEGESFDYIDGKPVFNDWVKYNPDGLTMKQTMAQYTTTGLGNFVGIQLMGPVWEQRFFDFQNEAIYAWIEGGEFDWRIPPFTIPGDIAQQYAMVRTDIYTHKNENFANFIFGDRSLDEFDDFVQEILAMNIGWVLEQMQDGYERFNARGN